jgi:uncharacterized protein (TIGR00255 family)
MLKSMTAYARAEKQSATCRVSAEIRTYNSRNLDTALHLTRPYMPLEEKVKALVAAHIHRGRVEVRIDIQALGEEQQAFEIDWTRARAYRDALLRLRDELSLCGEVSLDLLAGVGGILKPADRPQDMEAVWTVLGACLEEALAALERMRRREGETLAADFENRLTTIGRGLERIRAASDGLLDIYRERLLERVQRLTQGQVDIDPGRLAQEAAFLADRSDISEELVRAASHLEQFRRIMAGEAPAGRKLNFLLQEFNREFNTMGSKSTRTDIAHTVVDLKCELEKIREQVQNIE